jgi:glycosyltransferase involved in cell wall biosynthesis
LGWKVTVYADPGDEAGVYDGVDWQQHYNFNIRDDYNILIYWRSRAYADMKCKAKQTYLWCHDVQNPADYDDKKLKLLTKLIVLSKAHRENLPDVPDKKFLISSNGYFEHLPDSKPKRDPHAMLWTSSYDRGIEHLLNMWPDIKKAVPDATLNVFYGWKLFENFYRTNPERMAWMRKINKLMEQPGITHHGRVIQAEVEKWHKKCGIWPYPTHFYEINCISAIKAQLWGSVPVCIDYAALKETVKFGKKIKGDIWGKDVAEKYKKALIKALKDTEWQEEQRKKMMPWARKKYGWDKIAKQWTEEFGGVKNVKGKR